jgi:hypothetical protein
MPTSLLTLRASPAQMTRFTRAAKVAKARSRHAWALAVLEQAAAGTSMADDWMERRLRWIDEHGRRIPDEAGNPDRNR